MKTNKKDSIQDFIDGTLSEAEAIKIWESIESDKEMMREYKSLKEVHDLLYDIQKLEPSAKFTAQVMSNLEKTGPITSFNWHNLLIVFGIFICLVITSVSLSSSSAQVVEIPQQIDLMNRNINTTNLFIDSINLNVIFNGILFLAFILAMLFFDKTVLRPLLGKRKMI
ncbi:MAG: hypothetical protein OEW75_11960 [Cyclobacteriaceae bacterium]|nr:hypothetical protein [Cyclobacteriaceae bacterium]